MNQTAAGRNAPDQAVHTAAAAAMIADVPWPLTEDWGLGADWTWILHEGYQGGKTASLGSDPTPGRPEDSDAQHGSSDGGLLARCEPRCTWPGFAYLDGQLLHARLRQASDDIVATTLQSNIETCNANTKVLTENVNC